MSLHMYGIRNCDSIKKARRWLTERDIHYTFHDYKKEPVDAQTLRTWCNQVGWEKLLNKRGTTWRKLPESDKLELTQARAIALLVEHTSMIKRPVLIADKKILVGFSELEYRELLE